LATTTEAIISKENVLLPEGEHYEDNFDRKLQLATEGLQPNYARTLQQKLPHNLSSVIVDYVIDTIISKTQLW
jgi:hypothetical protein